MRMASETVGWASGRVGVTGETVGWGGRAWRGAGGRTGSVAVFGGMGGRGERGGRVGRMGLRAWLGEIGPGLIRLGRIFS